MLWTVSSIDCFYQQLIYARVFVCWGNDYSLAVSKVMCIKTVVRSNKKLPAVYLFSCQGIWFWIWLRKFLQIIVAYKVFVFLYIYIYIKTSLLIDMQSGYWKFGLRRGWLLFNIQLFVSDVRRFFGSDKLYVRLRGWDLSRWNTVAPCRVVIWMVAGTCAQTQIVPWP